MPHQSWKFSKIKEKWAKIDQFTAYFKWWISSSNWTTLDFSSNIPSILAVEWANWAVLNVLAIYSMTSSLGMYSSSSIPIGFKSLQNLWILLVLESPYLMVSHSLSVFSSVEILAMMPSFHWLLDREYTWQWIGDWKDSVDGDWMFHCKRFLASLRALWMYCSVYCYCSKTDTISDCNFWDWLERWWSVVSSSLMVWADWQSLISFAEHSSAPSDVMVTGRCAMLPARPMSQGLRNVFSRARACWLDSGQMHVIGDVLSHGMEYLIFIILT